MRCLHLITTKAIYIIIGFVVIAQFGCVGTCSPGSQNLRLSLSGGSIGFFPGNDSMHIGDTLWVTSTIPHKLKITTTGDSMDFRGAINVVTDLHIDSLTGTNSQVGAAYAFTFINNVGIVQKRSLDSTGGKIATYSENNEGYHLSFGMIPIKKGIYCLILIDIYQAQKRCTYASIEIARTNGDDHLHYLQDIYYNGGPVDPVSQARAFCFKVY